MSDFQLGDIVQMPHFEDGLTMPCNIVEFRSNEVRVENPELQGWTAWWPVNKLIKYKAKP
jgi:hypothetical protein